MGDRARHGVDAESALPLRAWDDWAHPFQEDSMSDALSPTEIDEQRAELLPARTVMSIFTTDASGNGSSGNNGSNGEGSGATKSGGGAFDFLSVLKGMGLLK
jgi:hypothetical protein